MPQSTQKFRQICTRGFHPNLLQIYTGRGAALSVRAGKEKRNNAEHAEKGKERGKHRRRTLLFPRLSNLFSACSAFFFWVLGFRF
jgi:hypothetical protein